MNIIEIIDKKSKGKVLSRKEIEYFINGYTNGIIPDYQVSSLLMAIKLKGMNRNETVNLTRAMLHSGDVNDLSSLPGVTVDKKEGVYKKLDEHIDIVDLPGIYSLSPYTPEEVILYAKWEEIEIEESLESRLRVICDFCSTTPTIINGSIVTINVKDGQSTINFELK